MPTNHFWLAFVRRVMSYGCCCSHRRCLLCRGKRELDVCKESEKSAAVVVDTGGDEQQEVREVRGRYTWQWGFLYSRNCAVPFVLVRGLFLAVVCARGVWSCARLCNPAPADRNERILWGWCLHVEIPTARLGALKWKGKPPWPGWRSLFSSADPSRWLRLPWWVLRSRSSSLILYLSLQAHLHHHAL